MERFRQRLVDPARNWKISEDDYREREYWDDYRKAYEDVFAETSTKHAPWYIIPANHKWFRDLAVSQIVAATLEELRMQLPKPQVDLEMIRPPVSSGDQGDATRRPKAAKRSFFRSFLALLIRGALARVSRENPDAWVQLPGELARITTSDGLAHHG